MLAFAIVVVEHCSWLAVVDPQNVNSFHDFAYPDHMMAFAIVVVERCSWLAVIDPQIVNKF